MIITNKFVMLNFPKTGSSFSRNVLKRIHAQKRRYLQNRVLHKLGLVSPSLVELMLPMIDRKHDYGEKGQHGTYRQIPEEHRYKRIVSITRNPFERYVSGYLFGWWKKSPYDDVEKIAAVFPSWPNLSFLEYYQMLNTFVMDDYLFNNERPRVEIGISTMQFIKFYFPEPEKILDQLDEEYLTRQAYREELPEITFLHQENLNEELCEFLLQVGYLKRSIDLINRAERVNVTPRQAHQHNLENFYTEEIVEAILCRDRLLFDMFPEYREPPL